MASFFANSHSRDRAALVVAGACLLACAASAACEPAAPPSPLVPVALPLQVPSAPEAAPAPRLPADTRPTHYAVTLRVDPKQARFEGSVDIAITLDRARDTIWLHGRDLAVHRATVQVEGGALVTATWEQTAPNGVAALRLPAVIGPGKATVHIEWDAPYGKSDQSLSVVVRGGESYAFSQFEAADARRAFPCFDEPGHKTPFDVTLVVPKGLVALSNAREIGRVASVESAAGGAWDRVTFAPTEPLPTYLVAFAVGPLDVVNAPDLPATSLRPRPLPFRGVATKGRGRELAYAMAHTPEIVAYLEGYFGVAYPYDKLDLIAVPEKNGAMENAGALMFTEGVLLLDDTPSSLEARFNFAAFVGHEIAHQWFGDLVTMPWWNDLWLNEAFATWMEPRILGALRPELHPEVHALEKVHEAMDADSLVSARKIRQEIVDDNDIDSAFDSITYDKGGAVLSMFERFLGRDTFQRGIRSYVAAHKYGTAGTDDLLGALSKAAGRDVGAPFHSFLDQPGLPFVEAALRCDGKPRLTLKQSRFLPLGSKGARDGITWQIPVCARYADGKEVREACTLLTQAEGSLELPTASCPAWVMPNADAAGYYRWSLPNADRKKLAQALPALGERERISFAKSLVASFSRGGTPLPEILESLAPLSTDPSFAVAAPLMDVLSTLRGWLEEGPARKNLEAYASSLFAHAYKILGWDATKGDDPGHISLRAGVIEFLAGTARDKAVRAEAVARGRAYLGLAKASGRSTELSPELLGVALDVTVEEVGARAVDVLLQRLASEPDEMLRRRMLAAIGSAREPAVAARVRELELDPRVHANETGRILAAQMRDHATREEAWTFFVAHLDQLIARMPPAFASGIIAHAVPFCDQRRHDELAKLFSTRVGTIEAGPRALAGALEELELCIARRSAHEGEARAHFARPEKKR